MRRLVLVVSCLLLALALFGALATWRGRGDDPEVASALPESDEWEDEELLLVEDREPGSAESTAPERRERRRRDAPGRVGSPIFREGRGGRHSRLLARLDVVPLGPSADNPTPESVGELVRDLRRVARDCMRAADVPLEVWQDARQEERRMTFSIGPDGRIGAGTFQVDPPLPAEVRACFAQAATTVQSQSRGEGADVTFTMPTRSPRSGDMGVR